MGNNCLFIQIFKGYLHELHFFLLLINIFYVFFSNKENS